METYMDIDETDNDDDLANKPQENLMTLPTIKKRYKGNTDHFGEFNLMEDVWVQKSMLEDDPIMQET